jgi:DNA-binding transcriptional LysR family regulator
MDREMGLDLIQSFVVAAEELNFRRSAERLNVDQSGLTRRIQKLEHILRIQLFERTTREVTLTPAGRSLYEESSSLLRNYEEAVKAARRLQDGKTGSLTVAYMSFASTELMPVAVARFRQAYPFVDVTLRYLRTQGQKLALARGEVDIGYMIGPFHHSEFDTLVLRSDPLYLITPKGHPFKHDREIRPADIADEQLILGDMLEWEAYRWRLTDLFSGEGVPLDVRLEASNTLALLGLVAAGLGVTILPESLLGSLRSDVEYRPIVQDSFRVETILAWRRSNIATAVRNFVEIAGHPPSE